MMGLPGSLLPFLAFRASEHSQSSRTAALGADECNGKFGDGKLPASESSACAACNMPCILAHIVARSCGAPGVFVPWFTREDAQRGKAVMGLARSLAFLAVHHRDDVLTTYRQHEFILFTSCDFVPKVCFLIVPLAVYSHGSSTSRQI
jgi:hypothetical protein